MSSLLSSLGQWILNGMQAFVTWLVSFTFSVLKPLLLNCLTMIPNMHGAAINLTYYNQMSAIISYVNQWFPLDWCATFFVGYCTLFPTYFAIKLIVRLF